MRTSIYHNPRCSKSRDVLKFLNDSGVDPEIVLYLESGWDTDTLKSLKTNTGLSWEAMLRSDATNELKTAIESGDDKVIINHILTNPVALERPFVTTPKGTRLCRPITQIFDIVDQRPASPWFTEKGELVL